MLKVVYLKKLHFVIVIPNPWCDYFFHETQKEKFTDN